MWPVTAGPSLWSVRVTGLPGSSWGKVARFQGRQQTAKALESDLVQIPGLTLPVCWVMLGGDFISLSLRS